MRASDIIERAIERADLKNSRFLTQNDRIMSLNEAWRDLYSSMTDSDDDYFLEVVTIAFSSAVAIDRNTYLLPVPVDCYKIRYLDYLTANGDWLRMDRFALEERNDGWGEPRYRWQGENLWISVSPSTAAPGSIRVAYYPSPAVLSAPEDSINFGVLLSSADRSAVVWPFYAPNQRRMVYRSGASIISEPIGALATSPAPVVLQTGAPANVATHIMYYLGYLYYVSGGSIYRGATELAAAVVPVALVGPANVSRSFIVNQRLYWYDTVAADILRGSLTGAGGALTGLGDVDWLCGYLGSIAYLSAAGAITVPAGVVPGIVASWLTSNGSDELFYLSGNDLHRLTLDGITVVEDYVIASDIGSLGIGSGLWSSALGFNESTLTAISLLADTDLAYPSNSIPEILAYQCAFDFKGKQHAPTEELQLLKLRRDELRQTLADTLKRDEYRPEKINNVFPRRYA